MIHYKVMDEFDTDRSHFCGQVSSSTNDVHTESLIPQSLSEHDFNTLLRQKNLDDQLTAYYLETGIGQADIFTPATRNQAMKCPQCISKYITL